jgi:hypothetical protein
MFLAQVSIDVVNAVRHLKAFLQPSALDDESLILKTILWEGFSGGVIRPWAIHAQRGPKTIIVGYSRFDASELNKRQHAASSNDQIRFYTLDGNILTIISAPNRRPVDGRAGRSILV